MGREAKPVGRDAKPVGRDAKPVGHDAKPSLKKALENGKISKISAFWGNKME